MTPTPRAVVLAVALVGLVALVALVAGCAGREETAPREPGEDHAGSGALGHVHGLGTDPADGTLYVATHLGVFRAGPDGTLSRVADRWQDTMAFTVAGPGEFLASGHPDLREDLPTHLGLIASHDAAQTWSILSLGGEADFHALELAGDRLYGYDALSGMLLTTTDRQRWEGVGRLDVVDLAADPDDPDRVIVSAPDGTLSVVERRGGPTPLRAAPATVLLDWPATDLLVGVGADGSVRRSRDGGLTWDRAADLPGAPQALDVLAGAWYAATEDGVWVSRDDGGAWRPLADGG